MTEIMHVVWRDSEHYKPEPGERVLCLTKTKKGALNYVLGYWSDDFMGWVCGMNSNVLAWAKLPEAPSWAK